MYILTVGTIDISLDFLPLVSVATSLHLTSHNRLVSVRGELLWFTERMLVI